MKKRSAKGFTLMELMVVIVIVAILAAVAVPLYINYVKDAQRTEAKGAIGAIITAEQAHFQRYDSYLSYTDAQFTTPPTAAASRLDCDVSEAQRNWEFTVTATAPGTTPSNFTVVSRQRGVTTNPLQVTYTLHPTGQDQWVDQ